MRQLLILLALTLLILPLLAIPLPRVYVQKLMLDDGKLPQVTVEKDKSAPEYLLRAWFAERPEIVRSTDEHSIHHLAVKQVGDDEVFPVTVMLTVQLGSFGVEWKEGETLVLEITHKASGQKKEWSIVVPPGSNLIKHLETPMIVPPFQKK
ncbi:MAG: hypothetical protein Q8J62_07475 [Candidatus Cloacimonadaceae bacterium]|nr:hypothetical protein [Candidatus Cloacimonadaceae bacterium]